jgi:hypothetical protein
MRREQKRLREYSKLLESNVTLRHDAKIRFTVASDGVVLEDRLISPTALNGALTVASIMYNRLSRSGGCDWWNPSTGQKVRRPKITVHARPEDLTSDTRPCECDSCTEVTA